MHLGRLERRRQSGRSDEMLLWNKQTGASTESPLRRLMQLLERARELHRFRRRRGWLAAAHRLHAGEILLKTRRVPPDEEGAGEKKQRCGQDGDAVVLCT